ncbi:hypothetical protein ACQKWADRAFT_265557 [Trichoderma austrokoningii]
MFLSRQLSKAETRYKPTELEVACLVWTCKKLRTLIQSCQTPAIVLTDHLATKGIVNHTTMTTSSLVKANQRLMAASIYLSQYKLDVHHIPGKKNLVPDALSRLPVYDEEGMKEEQKKENQNENENELDDIWSSDVCYTVTKVHIEDSLRQKFIQGYQSDGHYRKVLELLKKEAEGGKQDEMGKGNDRKSLEHRFTSRKA